MKTRKTDWRVRAADPKDDKRNYRAADWIVETREVGEGKDKKTERVVRCSISSETPYVRYMEDPESGEWVKALEVLGHKPEEIDNTRMRDGLVIQDTHYGEQIGIMDKPEIKDGKIVGTIRFGHSQKARDIEADALDGIKRNMSVGYIVNEYKRDGVDEKTGLPIFRVTNWTPYEASFVNCPADTNIGVGRQASTTENRNGNHAGTVNPETTTETTAPAVGERQNTMKLTAEQRQKIRELASAAHVSGEEVADILTSERSFEEIREELLNRREKYLAELAKKPAKPAEESRAVIDEGDKAKIRKQYDFVKVLRYFAEMSESKTSNIDIGFEREISDELAKQTGRAVQGILLPDFIRSAANVSDGGLTFGTPAYNTDTSSGGITGIGGAGKNLVETLLLSGQFIEALVATLVLRGELGAEVLSGLVGNISIPKGGSISGGWISAEGGNAPKKNPTVGQITATPHTYGAYVDITRKLLLQSSVNVQAKVLGWLMYACANGLETAAFQGTGSSGQPTGLCTALNSGATAWSNAPTFDKIIDLIAATKTANSYKPSMKFVGNAGVWAKLAKTRDFEILTDGADTPKNVAAIGGSVRLLDTATNKIVGRDFVEANLMPSAKLLFGDFTQLCVCLWSGTDIVIDPYANSISGGLRLVALQDSDILIKRPESFALATGVHS